MKGLEGMPGDVWLGAGIAGGVAALVTAMTVPLAAALGSLVQRRFATARRSPPPDVPRLGGLAVMAGIGSGSLLALVAGWHVWGHQIPVSSHVALVVTTGMVFLLGLVDDVLDLSALQKLSGQLFAAAALVASGWRFEVMSLPGFGVVSLEEWSWPLSLLWLVGVTNAINLIDGLDGLAGGVVSIIAGSLLILAVVQGNPGTVVLLAATTTACLAFLKDNWRPAKIYLGDSGSLSLGFLLGAVSLNSSLKAQTAVAILVPLLALGLPVLDMVLVMAYRFAESQGQPLISRLLRIFRGDRRHLHHLLQPLVRSHRMLLLLVFGLALAFCGAALYVAIEGNREVGWILLLVELGAVFLLRRAGLKALAESQAAQARSEVAARWRRWGNP